MPQITDNAFVYVNIVLCLLCPVEHHNLINKLLKKGRQNKRIFLTFSSSYFVDSPFVLKAILSHGGAAIFL